MEVERTGIVDNSWVPPWVSSEDYTDITPVTGLNASMPCSFQVILTYLMHNAKWAIHGNSGLTIGEQKNAIQNFYNPLLTEFRDMASNFELY